MANSVFELQCLRRKDLIALFGELDAPTVPSMNGEYRACLLDQGRWLHNFATILAFNFPGVWISKSFQPISDDRGCGYNSFRIGASIQRIYPMQTYVGQSQFDDRPSYHLNYGPSNRRNVPAITRLAGEVRQFGPSAYLGLGKADFGINALRRAQPFLLEGPVAPFVKLPAAA